MPSTIRAWRFWHPDLVHSGREAGLQLSAHNGIEMVEGDEAIRQAILILLSTVPGERVMRPDYGCNLHRLMFSPNDDTTAGLAIHYVRKALTTWEPRIEIVELDARRDPDIPEQLDILLVYRVKATLQTETLTFAFSLAGELSDVTA